MGLTTEADKKECAEFMKKCSMFSYCSSVTLDKLCANTTKQTFHKGQVIFRQGEKQDKMAIISQGKVERARNIDGQSHVLHVSEPGHCLGGHHVLNEDLSAATCRCLAPSTVFMLKYEHFYNSLANPVTSREIVYSLNREIRRQANLLQTPLFEQHPKPTPIFATSVAASLESFYRSALNASLNAKLTGKPPTSFFPNMGVQVPTRIVYINGFKGIRHYIDRNIEADEYSSPGLVRLFGAITPGLLMTPVSGLLEACNAGHMNAEPLQSRWLRGTVPRGLREVIFGIGLNQLSDYFEERFFLSSNPFVKNLGGSLIAGVVAGYLSHVPHNLSTLKLMNPQKTYYAHLMDLVKGNQTRVPVTFSANARFATALGFTLLFPRGLGIRTAQIVGSFMILNGTINSLKDVDPTYYFKNLLK